MDKRYDKNPSTFFSRKVFYAINCQCIVDDRNHILWMSYSHKGRTRDSSCLRETRLYGKLIQLRDHLYEKGFFVLEGEPLEMTTLIRIVFVWSPLVCCICFGTTYLTIDTSI